MKTFFRYLYEFFTQCFFVIFFFFYSSSLLKGEIEECEVKITISVIALALLVCIAPMLLAKHPVPISANNWTGILNILCFLVHFIWASQSDLSDLFFRTTICSSLQKYKSRTENIFNSDFCYVQLSQSKWIALQINR